MRNANVHEKINFIQSVTNDCLRGVYKPHEYKNIILPMILIKRFADCEMKNGFNDLTKNKEDIKINFEKLLNNFPDEVREVINLFDFNSNISKMDKANVLYLLIEKFNSKQAYFGEDEVSVFEMGYIFEHLLGKFMNNFEPTGEHFTPNDVTLLLSEILLHDFKNTTHSISCYDMTMGTSQMLCSFKNEAEKRYKNIKVNCYGQELNPETYAIAKANALISGRDNDKLYCANTLSDDKLKDFKFDFIISNPPYGVSWKLEKNAVIKDDRFKVGLPNIGDGQMLFILNGLSKLKDNGKMAIIHSGSVLFSGSAGSGESKIRRYLIENDLLDSVIKLPRSLFFNTEIETYVLVITKNKSEEKKGKIRLIDASKSFVKRKKPIGKKRVDIDEKTRSDIIYAYDKKHGEIKFECHDTGKVIKSKHFDNVDFGFYKITVERPKRDEYGNILYKKGKMIADSELRDTEIVPLTQTIEEYMAREVLPYAPDAWVDETKTKIGYEIPFARHFYEYVPPRPSQEILTEIMASEEKMKTLLKELLCHE